MTSWTRRTGPPELRIPPSPEWRTLPDGQTGQSEQGYRQPRYDYRLMPNRKLDTEFCRRVDADPHPSIARVRMALYLKEITGRFRRFCDIKQTRFTGEPAKDGTNLNCNVCHTLGPGVQIYTTNGSTSLLQMFLHHRDVLNRLHHRYQVRIRNEVYQDADLPQYHGTVPIPDYAREDAFLKVLNTGPPILREMEMAKMERSSGGIELQDGLDWIIDLEAAVSDTIAAFNAAHLWTQEYALDAHWGMEVVWASIPEMTRLVMLLIYKEYDFERKMSQEHIFDMLTDKRLSIMTVADAMRLGFPAALGIVAQETKKIRKELTEYQEQIRDVFDYYRLIDWGYGRLWAKLFFLPAEDDGISQITIERFRTWIDSASKLAYDIFGVHPISRDVVQDDICTICSSGFEAGRLIMYLRCDHRFHPVCLIDWWDRPNDFVSNCPNCRAPGRTLKGRIDFAAEKRDICYTTHHELGQAAEGHDATVAQEIGSGRSIGLWDADVRKRYWEKSQEVFLKQQRLRRKMQRTGTDIGDLDGPAELEEDEEGNENAQRAAAQLVQDLQQHLGANGFHNTPEGAGNGNDDGENQEGLGSASDQEEEVLDRDEANTQNQNGTASSAEDQGDMSDEEGPSERRSSDVGTDSESSESTNDLSHTWIFDNR